jgi:hypothetical protein
VNGVSAGLPKDRKMRDREDWIRVKKLEEFEGE